MELIKYEGIDISYNGVNIVSDFNLSIFKGEKVLVKGNSGTGKSTLMKLLLGFTQQTYGNLYFQGEIVDESLVWDIREKVAYVPQELDIGDGNVDNFINEILSYQVNRSSLDYSRIYSLLKQFNLKQNILSKDFENLSGGEKQRIAIVISLLINRYIYLLDEPTSALDLNLKKKVVDHFIENGDLTVFIVSHDSEWERERVKVVDITDYQNGPGSYTGL
ncbi:MAG: ATP-binding cassette domain-containing protein [Methanohalobium sp.]|uniref:ABC transporter ATP-binding protein n=1 Tax=Methanohalobium sp. TaxID=2837493 RepID=UPI00397815AD